MTPVNEAIEQQAMTTVEQARMIVVSSVPERTLAAEMGRAIASLDKEAEAFFGPMKKKAAEAHKEICAKENSVRKPLDDAKRYLSNQIGSFDLRLEQARRAEEARLQEEAIREAEEESKRLAAEQAIDDAIELEESGDVKGAEAVLANPSPVFVPVAPVILPKQVVRTEGVSSAQTWKFRVIDANKIPREYLSIDEKAIGQVVRALKNKTNIPGIEVYAEGAARFRA